MQDDRRAKGIAELKVKSPSSKKGLLTPKKAGNCKQCGKEVYILCNGYCPKHRGEHENNRRTKS